MDNNKSVLEIEATLKGILSGAENIMKMFKEGKGLGLTPEQEELYKKEFKDKDYTSHFGEMEKFSEQFKEMEKKLSELKSKSNAFEVKKEDGNNPAI